MDPASAIACNTGGSIPLEYSAARCVPWREWLNLVRVWRSGVILWALDEELLNLRLKFRRRQESAGLCRLPLSQE
jgi:hypothetical protein